MLSLHTQARHHPDVKVFFDVVVVVVVDFSPLSGIDVAVLLVVVVLVDVFPHSGMTSS